MVHFLFYEPDICQNCNSWLVNHNDLEREECKTDIKKTKALMRNGFSEDIRINVRISQGYRCNICGKIPRFWEYDHINGFRIDNSPDNCQGLCLDCHREKTILEIKKRKFSALAT